MRIRCGRSTTGIVRDVRVLEAEAVTAGERMFVIVSEPVGDRASERGVLQAQLGGFDARLANERLPLREPTAG